MVEYGFETNQSIFLHHAPYTLILFPVDHMENRDKISVFKLQQVYDVTINHCNSICLLMQQILQTCSPYYCTGNS